MVAWPCFGAGLSGALPKSVFSSEGFIQVIAPDVPGDPVGFRRPLLGFASGIVRDLSKTYSLEMPRVASPAITLHAGQVTTNDARVIVKTKVRSNGTLSTRILLPNPATADVEKCALEVAKAFFRFHSGEHEVPEWVVQGAMRAADATTRHDDILFVMELWARGRLPYFPALCTDLRVARGRAAALPGYVAAWIKEKKLFAPILKRLANGEKWDGGKLAEELTGEKEPFRQDCASDERLMKLMRGVLTPGSPSRWDFNVFASRLLLYSPFFDTISANGAPMSFRTVATTCLRTNSVVRAAAAWKARELPFYALGRGDGLGEAARAYQAFLFELANGKSERERLEDLLDVAEAKFGKAYEENRKNGNR